ncbi:unnamed protein product [Nippostrongylus brasiliensis]|uniref:DUF4238 domain-containing protein n=1 Tax=Nippostrongylus brasiliensis TaxID=27835 RepID=A0A0N4YG08_NIPBR|nr:unnamed protein product [Nippostrongylus brasiliensis]
MRKAQRDFHMGSFIRRQSSLKWVLVVALATFAAWKFFAMRRRPKYAAFQLNNAQFSDQLFDVCIGLGIAKLTSRRFHPIEMVRQEAADLHLRTVAAWFPKLKETMAQIKKSVVEKHTIPYVAPARQAISNTTNDDSIVLLFDERYTQEMWLISENEDELRNLLQYDDRTIEEAQRELWKHKIYNRTNLIFQLFDVCIGLGIAKLTSRRFHPIEMVRQEAADLHLRTVAAWFPKLKETMAQIKKSVVEKHTIPYVAPARHAISNTTNDDSIVLLFDERYTQEMWLISENEDELRNLLQYDDRTIEEAQRELWKHKIYNSHTSQPNLFRVLLILSDG